MKAISDNFNHKFKNITQNKETCLKCMTFYYQLKLSFSKKWLITKETFYHLLLCSIIKKQECYLV